MSSETRWLDYIFPFGPFLQQKVAQLLTKFAKGCYIFCQILFKPNTIYQRLLKFFQRSTISPIWSHWTQELLFKITLLLRLECKKVEISAPLKHRLSLCEAGWMGKSICKMIETLKVTYIWKMILHRVLVTSIIIMMLILTNQRTI